MDVLVQCLTPSRDVNKTTKHLIPDDIGEKFFRHCSDESKIKNIQNLNLQKELIVKFTRYQYSINGDSDKNYKTFTADFIKLKYFIDIRFLTTNSEVLMSNAHITKLESIQIKLCHKSENIDTFCFLLLTHKKSNRMSNRNLKRAIVEINGVKGEILFSK